MAKNIIFTFGRSLALIYKQFVKLTFVTIIGNKSYFRLKRYTSAIFFPNSKKKNKKETKQKRKTKTIPTMTIIGKKTTQPTFTCSKSTIETLR